MLCDYCNKKEGEYTLKNGKICCMPNFQSCEGFKKKASEKLSEILKSQYDSGKRTSHFKKWNDGSFWKGRKHTEETKRKLSSSGSGRKMSDEFKKKRKLDMEKRYSEGWECRAGRTKKIKYFSEIAGEVTVDGLWELNVCKFLDSQKIKWERNKKRFKYTDTEGRMRSYCPDFYLVESDTFLEIKGFETDLDRLKWSQFSEKLIVWKKKELIERNIIGG